MEAEPNVIEKIKRSEMLKMRRVVEEQVGKVGGMFPGGLVTFTKGRSRANG
jgi:hypothetical protein